MIHARHKMSLRTSTARGSDETLRNQRWHDSVIAATEVNLRDARYLRGNVDGIERSRHCRHMVEAIDLGMIKITGHGTQ